MTCQQIYSDRSRSAVAWVWWVEEEKDDKAARGNFRVMEIFLILIVIMIS